MSASSAQLTPKLENMMSLTPGTLSLLDQTPRDIQTIPWESPKTRSGFSITCCQTGMLFRITVWSRFSTVSSTLHNVNTSRGKKRIFNIYRVKHMKRKLSHVFENCVGHLIVTFDSSSFDKLKTNSSGRDWLDFCQNLSQSRTPFCTVFHATSPKTKETFQRELPASERTNREWEICLVHHHLLLTICFKPQKRRGEREKTKKRSREEFHWSCKEGMSGLMKVTHEWGEFHWSCKEGVSGLMKVPDECLELQKE